MRGKHAIDETGARYGRLVVLAKGESYKAGFKWLCMCDCGNAHQVTGSNLRLGYARSCGKCSAFTLRGDEAACRQAHNNYRRNARYRGFEFGLEVSEFRMITQAACHYCGADPDNQHKPARATRGALNYVYNGIDRVDNAKGYVAGNMVACCKACNRAKSDMPQGEFLAWIDRLTNHRKTLQ